MTAATIAAALGGAYRSGAWWRAVCPVHGSRTGRSASLSLKDGARGLIVHCHAGCTRADVLAELARRGLYSGAAAEAPSPDPEAERRRAEAEAASRARRTALARDMWRSSLTAAGTAVERYLCYRLPGLGEIPPTLRYLPPGSRYARHPEGAGWPVMLAAVKREGEAGIVAVHRTWLSPDGSGKKASFTAPRKSTGPVGGGAVRLGTAQPDKPLVIAEGIESALAAMIFTGWSGWAALSAGGIERLILPDGARDIVIACDRDPSGVGESKARAAACRWVREGRRVRLLIPNRIGTDPNDLLREARRDA